MTSPEAASDQTTSRPAADVDVLVVGGGITGIYQLYLAREAGFSAQLLEAGDGVGGTWYWNRYPGARFDSESYTYAYLFSRELFDEWEWQEHFAEQPEIERYLNHVVDRFDLRRHMRFGARVTSADYDEPAGAWTVDRRHRHRRRGRATSWPPPASSRCRTSPTCRGARTFEGESYHTGLWPDAPVDFAGKRVAVIGTGSSGVQIIPVIAETAASLTVLPALPQLVHAAQQRAHHARRAGAAPDGLRGDPRHPEHVTERVPPRRHTIVPPSTTRRRSARRSSRRCGAARGFSKLTSNYTDLMFDRRGQRGVVRLPGRQDPRHRRGPRDGGQAHPEGPPLRREAPAVRDRLLRGLQPARTSSLVDLQETPMVRMTADAASRPPTACGNSTSSCGRPASTSAPARWRAWASGAGTVWPSWTTGPMVRRRSSGFRPPGSPTSSSPVVRTPPPATTRATTATRSTSSPRRCSTCAATATTSSRSTEAAEEKWTNMVDRWATKAPAFGESSYYFGTNIPGKPRKYLLNSAGRPKLLAEIAEVRRDRLRGLHALAVPSELARVGG